MTRAWYTLCTCMRTSGVQALKIYMPSSKYILCSAILTAIAIGELGMTAVQGCDSIALTLAMRTATTGAPQCSLPKGMDSALTACSAGRCGVPSPAALQQHFFVRMSMSVELTLLAAAAGQVPAGAAVLPAARGSRHQPRAQRHAQAHHHRQRRCQEHQQEQRAARHRPLRPSALPWPWTLTQTFSMLVLPVGLRIAYFMQPLSAAPLATYASWAYYITATEFAPSTVCTQETL